MAYQKQTWEDLPSTNTPITAERLNHMEEGIANAVETDSVARVTNVVSRNKAGLKEIAWLQSMDYINTTSNGVKYKAKAEQYTGFNLILSKSLEIGKEYTISFKNNSSNNISFSITKTNTGWQNDYDNAYVKSHFTDANASYSYTFTATSNIIGIMFICSTTNNADTNERNIIDIQVEEGSTATSYVPYLNLEEAMQKKVIYSTSEQVIGKWIDGKTLYQRTFVLTPDIAASITSTQISLNTSNVKIAMLDPSASYFLDTQGSTGYMPFPNVNSNAAALCGGYPSVQNGNIQIQIRKGGSVAIYELILTIRYTKTTD